MIPSSVATGYTSFVRLRGVNTMGRIFVGLIILSFSGLLVGVESFLPASSLLLATPTATTTTRISNYFHRYDSRLDLHYGGQLANLRAQACPQQPRHRYGYRHSSSRMILHNSGDDTNANSGGATGILESIGLVSQPIVWISLYSLGTTGHGLPAGPGGAIGALEGIAYLVVVGLAFLPTSMLAKDDETDDGKGDASLARTLSRSSIALGLLVLAGVAVGKGCVPNAKPILDYSAYLPVCGPES